MKNILSNYPWYDNDILAAAIRVFKRTGGEHNEVLESALGIGKKLAEGEISEAQMLGVQLRIVMGNMQSNKDFQPPDEGQLRVMMCSDDYPMDVRERIAEVMGYPSLDKFISDVREKIPGLERLR